MRRTTPLRTNTRLYLRILPAATCTAVIAGAAAAEPELPRLEITLRPSKTADPGPVGAVDVTMRIDPVDAKGPSLRMPLVVGNVETVANSLSHLQAEDSAGSLALRSDTLGAPGSETKVWTAKRQVEGALILQYRAPLELRLAPRGAAPPLELRGHEASFSGAGSTFLILPEGNDPRRISVRWDLSALPAGSKAVSNVEQLDGSPAAAVPPPDLERSFFMAGQIGHYREPSGGGHFRAAWQGVPPFDPTALMAWSGRLHQHFNAFFQVPEPRTFTVFLRPNAVNPGGGVGLADAFVATFDKGTDGEALKLTLAHEMFHTFAPAIREPGGLESSWFGEGLATHYQRVLPFRFGQISAEQFLDNLNSTAARYYTSAMAEVPNSEVPRRFWEDTRIRTLPYDRGALYFAEVDDRIKTRSRGERSLDDLLLAMTRLQRTGEALSNSDWEALLKSELGDEGVRDFRAMLDGRPPLPDSDAFGRCFRRTQRMLRRYELGFDPKVLVEPQRIVRGLIPGSAAERAGLRNGDEIVRPVPQDRIQGDQSALLHLHIRRDGIEIPVSYLPRGEHVAAWQWELARTPDETCRI